MAAPKNPLVLTAYTILRVGLPLEVRSTMMKEIPALDDIGLVVRPAIGLKDDEYFERVSVLHEGGPVDMFVDELGSVRRLPRNDEATKIYHAFWLTKHPDDDVAKLPYIHGTAVLFSRRIWF